MKQIVGQNKSTKAWQVGSIQQNGGSGRGWGGDRDRNNYYPPYGRGISYGYGRVGCGRGRGRFQHSADTFTLTPEAIDRYYDDTAWWDLTPAMRQQIQKAREERAALQHSQQHVGSVYQGTIYSTPTIAGYHVPLAPSTTSNGCRCQYTSSSTSYTCWCKCINITHSCGCQWCPTSSSSTTNCDNLISSKSK